MTQSTPLTSCPYAELPAEFRLAADSSSCGTGTDKAHVQMLAEVATFGELPPILVQRNSLRVIDGMHRLEAAKARDEKFIRARVINCTDNDAYILAVKANTLHGLPLSRADRVSSARRILDWHPDWSDRAIGIAYGPQREDRWPSIRRESADEIQPISPSASAATASGAPSPPNALEGRKRAAEYITARPEASLREVARETDVSLGTVQDVRARMRRGLDPVTAGGGDRASWRPRRAPRSAPCRLGQPIPGPAEHSGARDGPAPEPDRPAAGAARRPAANVAADSAEARLHDPSLRYTEGGRAFMRWMSAHMMNTSQWREFADAVPSHWLDDLSTVAEQASEEWRGLRGSTCGVARPRPF